MGVNRWPIEYFSFLIHNNKKKLSPLPSLRLLLFLKNISYHHCISPSQYQSTTVFYVIINNNPPGLSLSRHPSKFPQTAPTLRYKVQQSPQCDISRLTERSLRWWGETEEKSGGGRSVGEECSIMYSGFVQVTVGSNAAVTHLKLALACPQRRTEALQALANPYSPDTCSAWRIHRYWPSIQPAFRVDEKR